MDLKLSQNDLSGYLHKMSGKIYKALPIFEDFPETYNDYLSSLVRELHGSLQYIDLKQNRIAIITVINTLTYLRTTKCSKPVVKTELFKCIGIVNHINGDMHEF